MPILMQLRLLDQRDSTAKVDPLTVKHSEHRSWQSLDHTSGAFKCGS